MLFKKIDAVSSENNTDSINTLFGQKPIIFLLMQDALMGTSLL
jgi:hypothetical protein